MRKRVSKFSHRQLNVRWKWIDEMVCWRQKRKIVVWCIECVEFSKKRVDAPWILSDNECTNGDLKRWKSAHLSLPYIPRRWQREEWECQEYSTVHPFPPSQYLLWNSLLSNLRQSDLTLHQFCRALKTYLLGWLRLRHLVTFVFSVLYKCSYLLTLIL